MVSISIHSRSSFKALTTIDELLSKSSSHKRSFCSLTKRKGNELLYFTRIVKESLQFEETLLINHIYSIGDNSSSVTHL